MFRATLFELVKFRVQKKNYVMLAGHLLFLLLCYFAFISTQSSFFRRFDKSMEFEPQNLASYLDGLFFARVAMVPTFIVLMPVVIATIAGDCVAGEMQDGSLKLYVSRPRSRAEIILSKFFAVYLVTLAYTVYFSLFNLGFAGVCRGFSPTQMVMLADRAVGTDVVIMPFAQALANYFLTTLYFSFSLMTLGSLALFFSTLFNRMTTATVTVITLHLVSYVIAALPFSEKLRPWLLSEIMNNGFLFWLSPVPWQKLGANITLLGLYIVVFLLLAILNFNYKDLK